MRQTNALAGRWAEAVLPEVAGGCADAAGNVVFAAVGVWPLLAALTAGAHGRARQELAAAVGLPAEQAMAGARGVVEWLRGRPGLSAAVGMWVDDRIEVLPDWACGLPEHTLGRLAGDAAEDRRRLDAWAARSTGGLIPAMPVELGPGTLLVLAAAMTARTRWLRPFLESVHEAVEGPWAGRELASLVRATSLLDRAAVLHPTGSTGVVTELRVLGHHGIDVHLLMGDERTPPARVLAAGLEALAAPGTRVAADVLPPADAGPGMRIDWTRSRDHDPELWVTAMPFTVDSEHDLLAHKAVFGLEAAAGTDEGHFSGISRSMPLAVGSARQSAMARFTATGFEAAAVTAFGLLGGGIPAPPPYRVKRVEVELDRPHGFLTVHRTSRMVLAGGWVGTAEDYRFDGGR